MAGGRAGRAPVEVPDDDPERAECFGGRPGEDGQLRRWSRAWFVWGEADAAGHDKPVEIRP